MGLFGNLFDALWKPKLADPVPGTAQVVSSSMPPYKSGGGGGGPAILRGCTSLMRWHGISG